ncbi:hypothetical protein PM082_006290 [Marasmius tenuissimus]|nr:hypothetical protein PM082_006290 [Marasmius tenuissimus]
MNVNGRRVLQIIRTPFKPQKPDMQVWRASTNRARLEISPPFLAGHWHIVWPILFLFKEPMLASRIYVIGTVGPRVLPIVAVQRFKATSQTLNPQL